MPEEYGATMSVSQEDFLYEDAIIVAIETTISSDRMKTYLTAAGFDRIRALRLYLWNARMSESYYFPLQCAEVTLRNSIHELLTEIYDAEWPFNLGFKALVGEDIMKAITKAQQRIEQAGYAVSAPRIVSGLSFDFWASLFANRFDRPLWQTTLRDTFPHLPGGISRRDLRDLVKSIKAFRNRVAHHEPIIKVDHSLIHTNILRLIRFRCAETAAWVNHHSRVPSVIRERP